MLAKTLRDDQLNSIQALRWEIGNGNKRAVLQAPTGFGKTVVAADMVRSAQAKGKRVVITVPALSLVDQTVEAFFAQGISEIGVIQAQHEMTDWAKPVQVCSVQTLQKCWTKGEMPEADIVLVDEVHRMFSLFSDWITDPKWQDVPFIGFSATPWSKGLGMLYGALIVANTIEDMIEQKTLVPFRTFAPDMPDLSGVRTIGGDFVEADLDEVMRPKKLVANIVDAWKQLAEGRPTVAFCCSRAHANQVAQEFEAAGIGAAYMDCETPLRERREVRRRMLDGDVTVVCNVEIIGIGVDWPEVSCISYCRPTMSDMRFCQNIGRGLRPHPGKQDLLILDHSTTTARLGFINEVYACHTTLDDGKTKPKAVVAVALPKPCPHCNYLKAPRTSVCPNCGHKVEEHAKPILVERGSLREVKPGDDMAALRRVLPDKAHVFGQLWYWAKHKGYKSGYAAVKTKEIFGSFPRAREPEPETISPPCPELVAYLYDSTKKWKNKQDYAKRKAAQQRGENGAPKGALTDREQAYIDRVRDQFVPDTYMTEQDYDDFR